MALQIILLVLIILISVSLIFLVIIQNSKGGGLASNMRAASIATQLMGPRRDSDFIEKATWWMISVLVLITFVANFTLTRPTGEGPGAKLRLQEAIENQKPNLSPTSVPSVPSETAPAEGVETQEAPAGEAQPAGNE